MNSIYHLIFLSALCGAASGQQYVPPQWNNCISVNNANATLINNCNVKLSVTGVPIGGPSVNAQGWQIDISPHSTGMSDWGVRGYEFYVCPTGYIPVDGDGHTFSSPIAEFQCKDLR